jgi:hypothetical protein
MCKLARIAPEVPVLDLRSALDLLREEARFPNRDGDA